MAGEKIAGRYRLLEPLGRGAMSAVWLAEDEDLERQVAVKTLAPTADRSRFEREARAVAALSHPNICGLFDYGEADGKPYMVLEFLPGGTLEERLRAGMPLPDAETQLIAEGIAAGLAHAHERGLVHRDVKPANVLFDSEGRPKIADFGIARMGNAGTLTEAGTVLGTASYISPEQAGGHPAGAPSDVYSFGVILFRMLTGRLPFVGTNAMELVQMHRDDPPPTVSDLRRDAPPALAWLADAALAKDPARRPPDGAALLAALTGAGDAGATQVLRSAGRKPRPFPLVPVIAAALVLLGGGIALALTVAQPGGGAPSPAGSQPRLVLPTVPSVASTAPTTATVPPTTAKTTTAHTAIARTTASAPATTQAATATRPATPTSAAPAPAPPPPPATSTIATTTTTDTTTTTGSQTTAAPPAATTTTGI